MHTGNMNTHLDAVDLSSGFVLDFMRLTSEDSTPLDEFAAKAEQAVLEVSLDLVCQVLGVSGNSFAGVSDFPFHLNPQAGEMRLVLHISHASAGCQQSLGGNTASVDASAAHIATSKDSRRHSLPPTVQRSPMAAHATTDDGNVEFKVLVSHGQGAEPPGLRHTSTGGRKGQHRR
jgi:hypothetical protein